MNRTAGRAAAVLFVIASLAVGQTEAELVRRALCTDRDVTREIELHSVAGVADVCDIVVRTAGEPTEERVLHPAAPRSALCAARFEGTVRASSDRGWQCSVEVSAGASPRAIPPPQAEAAKVEAVAEIDENGAGSSARTWRSACVAAYTDTETRSDAATLCDCAIELLREAGFEERDFEVLASPYDDAGLDRPVHRAGLLYGVGMMAVDALARCEAS